MRRIECKAAITAGLIALSFSSAADAQHGTQKPPGSYSARGALPPTTRASTVRISKGPELESARYSEAIIRWTSNNPGGTDEHWGVVHYGVDPKHLDQVAKSHIRLNRTHPETVFRVRVDGLKPAVTYYYTVDSAQANGDSDGVKSGVSHFTTPGDTAQTRTAATGKTGQ